MRTIRAAKRWLQYPDLRWYVADDGSQPEHVEALAAELQDAPLLGGHSDHRGYGGNANWAWAAARDVSPLTFWLEDDWELTGPFDLTPYAQLLDGREDIGMVRLGYLNLNMRGSVFGHGGRLYWRLDRDCDSYVFTGHPALRHERFHKAYGDYQLGLNPGETELSYALQFRNGQGPDIVWPAGIGEWGAFGHIGEHKSY